MDGDWVLVVEGDLDEGDRCAVGGARSGVGE